MRPSRPRRRPGSAGTRRTPSCGSSPSGTARSSAAPRSRPRPARHCYRGVGEVSVYVAEEARGAGLGRVLLDALVERSEAGRLLDADGGRVPRERGVAPAPQGVRLPRARRPRAHRRDRRRLAGRRLARAPLYAWSAREVPVRRLPVGAREPRARARALSRRPHPGRVVPRRRRRPLRSLGARTPGAIRCRLPRTSPPQPGAPGSATGVYVVAYGNGGGPERLWWLLRHFGHDDCAVLLGGIEAWGGELRAGEEEIEPAEFVPRERERRHDRGGRDRAPPRRSVARARRRAHRQPLARRAERDRRPARPDPRRRERSVERAAARAGRRASSSRTAARVSRPASRSTAPGSPAATAASIRARGASGRRAACRSSAAADR